MNRDEFEKAYSEKYLEGDYIVARDNRDGEGYTDHHIDLCWKVQKAKQIISAPILKNHMQLLEW